MVGSTAQLDFASYDAVVLVTANPNSSLDRLAKARERTRAERGWQADLCLVRPDKSAGMALDRQLATATYDCVVIGAGVRLPPKSLLLFETLINAVHKSAPSASIAFNTRPQDTAEAAARWL
jgi:hypothetical protein